MTVDYEAVIADLEAKRQTFNGWVDNAIQSIRQIQATVSGLSPAPASLSLNGLPPTVVVTSSLTPDAFFGLGLAEAAIKYLQIIKKQKTTREITDALEAAHYPHSSTHFINTVNTALYRRTRDVGDVVKIDRQWALAEWYPGRRRSAGKGRPEADPEVHSDPIDAIDHETQGLG